MERMRSPEHPTLRQNPGDPIQSLGYVSITFDWMPKQYITFRWEYGYRHANVPYFSGRGGITPGVNTCYQHDSQPSCRISGAGHNLRAGPVLVRDAGFHLRGGRRVLPRPAKG